MPIPERPFMSDETDDPFSKGDSWRRSMRPVVRPPGKRPKRLPLDLLTCSLCGGPNVSRPGVWLGRGEYALECASGCWGCGDCGELHRGDEDCPYGAHDDPMGESQADHKPPDDDDVPF